MKPYIVNKRLIFNLDRVTHVELFHDPQNETIEKARVFLAGTAEPLVLSQSETAPFLEHVNDLALKPEKPGFKGLT